MAHTIILPTSHIAEESIKAVKRVISQEKPDCVAVELDINRFMSMEGGEVSSWEAFKRLGPWTFTMFFVMKRVQSWLGKKVGIMPGSDMLSAVKAAEKEGVHVAFMDRDMAITLDRLSRVSWREKARLLLFLLRGLTLDTFLAKAGRGRSVRLDLRKVPPKDLIREVMGVLSREFPGIHRVLVSERDMYMARRLAGLSTRFEKIIAVVGAAHAPGLQRLLSRRPKGS